MILRRLIDTKISNFQSQLKRWSFHVFISLFYVTSRMIIARLYAMFIDRTCFHIIFDSFCFISRFFYIFSFVHFEFIFKCFFFLFTENIFIRSLM